ncbi:MAG TPA: DUF4166 domain-containing protein [Pyrinomonadaceae bacterium]|nr:DUF4166 domain-containing protein [Pyrinomonadaceae bacterium]
MNANLPEKSHLSDKSLQEARRYLPESDLSELQSFAERQLAARRRVLRLKKFYGENFCRLTRLHLLAACAISLGRFCGVSRTFDEIGESLMPVDAKDQPISEDWKIYSQACQNKMPAEVCDELWLTAHFKDIENIRAKNLEEKFYAEAEKHKNAPVWLLLKQHLEVTLGVRLMDKSAIAGLIPHETAIADSLALTVKKLSTACVRLVGRYAAESARAVFDFSDESSQDVLSYRQTAVDMTRYFLLSASVSKTFRRGLRERERGSKAETENWNLLENVLGERVSEIDPLIREFYSNPSRFDVTATLKLETLPARIWSRLLTLLFGQGLFETDLEEIPARFRIFERKDGSMHFIRELYCDGKYRVFDSDFIVENGKLYEVFTDLKASVEMHVEPIENRGLSIQGKRILFHGRQMPSIGLTVEFQSKVENGTLKIDGQLMMKPNTKFGQFFAHKILRRPQNLGSIHYTAQRKTV